MKANRNRLAILPGAVFLGVLLMAAPGAQAKNQGNSTSQAVARQQKIRHLETVGNSVRDLAQRGSALGSYYDPDGARYVVVVPSTGKGSELDHDAFAAISEPVEIVHGKFAAGDVDRILDTLSGRPSGTSTPVKGAGDPSVNITGYCRSGMVTFELCSQTVTSLNGSFCVNGVNCRTNLIVYTDGGLAEDGDSPAPFYLPNGAGGAYIRGIHIGHLGQIEWAEPWSQIVSGYGFPISIVTW